MVIAIDGPAGSGKSSVAREVARRTGMFYLNSGNFYRAITWRVLQENAARAEDTDFVTEIAHQIDLTVRDGHIHVDGSNVDGDLHSDAVDTYVARHSSIPAIRNEVNRRLKATGNSMDLVVEGRDMGTEVFPHAEHKFFLDASIETRAARRHAEGMSAMSLPELKEAIRQRDEIDRNKKMGGLRRASDAVYIDTSDLTIDAVCEKVIANIHGHVKTSGVTKSVMSDKPTRHADVSDQTNLQQELQEEYLKSLDELEVGQLVEGTVIEVGPEQVFVDVGYKSEGKIPTSEFDETPEIGDTVNVVLLNKETTSGEVVVSKKKADEKVLWKTLRTAFQDHEAVEGTVDKSIKGGFEVSLGAGVRAFNPISKMDLHRIEEPEEYIGLKSHFYIERLYSDNRINIVVSRRDWLEEEVERKRGAFFEHVKIGDVVEGIVKSFTSFGSFIDLGGFDGLLHINDMSWGHVTRPKDFVKKGQRIQLKVIRMDPEEQKINLSLKHMTEDPWNSFEDKFHVDQVVKGTVTKLTDFGAFIELEEGIEGLAHISELSWVKRINHPKEILKVGDEVETKILSYDIPNGKVSLGIKQVLPNPWENVEFQYPVGTRLKRPVKKITNSGAFVELEEGMDAFLHVDDISWTKKFKHPSAALQEGEEIECMVVSVDPETHNVRVGIKQLEDDPWSTLKNAYPENSIIEGEITNITDFGVFVRVPGGIEGLINKAAFSDPRIEPYEKAVQKYKVGDPIKAVVNEINPVRQKLSLSLRDLERKTQAEELRKYMQDDESGATFTLGDFLREDSDESATDDSESTEE